MKIAKKSVLIDPLEFFPYEICEQIFDNLSVRDLLRASCVSSSWYKYIGDNQKLMSKIKVKTSCNMDQEYAQEIIIALTNSERQYENLEVERCGQCMFPINGLLLSKKWKNVTIIRSSFLYPQETVEFFRCFEESVVDLQMNAVYVKYAYSDGKNKGLMFPNLKRFSARNVQAFFFHEVFQNLEHLQHFEIFSNDQNVASLNAVMNFLFVNKDLRSLQVSGSVFYQILYEDISPKIEFQLNTLVVANGSYHQGSPFYERIYQNLAYLIAQQSKSLKYIRIDDWMGETVLRAIYKLPNLKELTIKGFTHIYDSINYKSLNLHENTSIAKLHVSMIPDDVHILEAIVKSTPALQHLSISFMNPHFMDLIGLIPKRLTHLSVGYLNVTHIENKEMFQSLRQLEIKDYRSCLKESIVCQPFEKLGKFEKMFYEALVGY